MKLGWKWMIIGMVFWFCETWYFGWNMTPICAAAWHCDMLAVGLAWYGAGIIRGMRYK